MFDDRMIASLGKYLIGVDSIDAAVERATRNSVALFQEAMLIHWHRNKVRAAAARRRTAKQRKRRHLARARR